MKLIKFSYYRILILLFVIVCSGILISGCDPNENCSSNGDCSVDQYCRIEAGDCGSEGLCELKPVGCPEILQPVCGCNGVTYENDCMAAEAGQNVAYKGECKPVQCWNNDMCQDDEYCLLEDCGIKSGACMPRPQACPDVWLPVCGCDGKTYGNACEAAAAGMSVDYEGECKPVTIPCRENADCLSSSFAPNVYCAKEEGNCNNEGECLQRPEMCPDVWAPVCGCDGKTYGNVCSAAAAGVNVDYAGECIPVTPPCVSNDECTAANEYCAKNPGDCDGNGDCKVRPDACYDLWAPVCGCDSKTYGNDCEAAAAGINIQYQGECRPEACFYNSMCEMDEYCVFEPCEIETGYCAPRPFACDEVDDPVCGCDMSTYSNSCEAAVAGTSVLYMGPCNQEECCFDQCGDGVCDQLMCYACGCPCYETAETCPQDCARQQVCFGLDAMATNLAFRTNNILFYFFCYF